MELHQGIDKILSIYQSEDCQLIGLDSIDRHTILVLAKYNGDMQRGPLLPGANCLIMISARWRMKSRLKNDPVCRHAYNTISNESRTKHLSAVGVSKIQPDRLFKHGASMGLLSQQSPLRNSSRVLGFTTIPCIGKRLCNLFQDCAQNDGQALSEGLRTVVRQAVFATKFLNEKGMAMSPVAFNSAYEQH